MHIGIEIRRAREAKGWNQSELGRRLGVSPQCIQQWEAGETYPGKSRWEQIAVLLDIPIEHFLVTNAAEVAGRYNNHEFSAAALRVAKRWDALPHDAQKVIDRLLEIMANYTSTTR